MADMLIRIEGHAGRITLNRPDALNALTYEMIGAIETALDQWSSDDRVALVIIDAVGDKAFCAGGDIQQLYETGLAKDFGYGKKFWADEYRLNAKIAKYPKPYIAFMQGFTMGGGVGVSCHGSHRIVCESSQTAMPECGIGLVPDVGGSLLLANAPGYLGEYLGLTAERMGAADAIYAGFADHFISGEHWPEVIASLCNSGNTNAIARRQSAPGPSRLMTVQSEIDGHFQKSDLTGITASLAAEQSDLAKRALQAIHRNSPLSMAYTIRMIRELRQDPTILNALDLEYRFTARSMEFGDFMEGIRAAIIDKDKQPVWKHSPSSVPKADIDKMHMPLGGLELGL